VGFAPAAASVGVGQTTSVELRIDSAGREVGHAPLHVVFDPAFVEIVDVQEGDFLRRAGRSTFFQHEVRGGRLVLGASLVGTGPGTEGSGTLAILVVQGKAPGRSALRLEEVHVWDPALTEELRTAVSVGSVEVRG
jgi:hypothetical protein